MHQALLDFGTARKYKLSTMHQVSEEYEGQIRSILFLLFFLTNSRRA
jgi:hypothetical protein